jgi:hypothetical protein
MKNILLSGFLLVALASHAQNILRVNNTPGVNTPYTTLAAAITAAGVNDVIMVEGSTVGYGNHSITKKVTIVGPGYFLTENTGLQVNPNVAAIGSVDFLAGSSGSSISGMAFFAAISIQGVNNISFVGNYAHSNSPINLYGTTNNTIIRGNYISAITSPFIGNGTHTNILFSNNYMASGLAVISGNSIITNNVFETVGHDIRNSNIQNNIFLTSSGYFSNISGSTIIHNLFTTTTQAGADASNIFNVNPSSLFLGIAGNTTDTQWKLKAASPAIGAGIGGTDCGMYGGSSPYKPSGIATGQHTVYNLLVPATVIQNGTLNVKVSARVN